MDEKLTSNIVAQASNVPVNNPYHDPATFVETVSVPQRHCEPNVSTGSTAVAGYAALAKAPPTTMVFIGVWAIFGMFAGSAIRGIIAASYRESTIEKILMTAMYVLFLLISVAILFKATLAYIAYPTSESSRGSK